jgi:signal transduction histidine kinase
VKKDFGHDLPLVRVDKGRIEQVMIIILDNAVDAMNKGGVLKIATRVVTVDDRRCVEIVFTDSGCGIKEEDMPRLFEPFFTTKRPGKGTGLGLSVAFSIIKEHNGLILVESPAAGQKGGATFKVRLPAVS